MNEQEVDVIICTKDRYDLLRQAVDQAKSVIPCARVVIVDSSVEPNLELLKDVDAEAVFTPNALLGQARQIGLETAKAYHVAFIDDDIILEKDWFRYMKESLQRENKTVAVSSRIIFGWQSEPLLEKLFRKGMSHDGGSIGICLIKRKEVLELGGFNTHIHRGEDS